MEKWNLYVRKEYQATQWPWPSVSYEEIGSGQIDSLPGAVDDFTRYAPEDGTASMSEVPADLPREWAECYTRMAVYHDELYLYVFLVALAPANPIPQLASDRREDLSCYFAMDGLNRGLYFGVNESEESICLAKVWDQETQRAEDFAEYPWSQFRDGPWRPLDVDYAVRIIEHEAGVAAAWRIARHVVAKGMAGDRMGFTAGRRCYATSELVSWTSSSVWETRHDELGTLVLVDEPESPRVPVIRRVDLTYDPAKETGTLEATWEGVWPKEQLESLTSDHYADRVGLYTVALNGQEQTGPIAGATHDSFQIPDGWNRVEYLNAVGQPALVFSVQKFSGNRVVPGLIRETGPLPSKGDLQERFARWHAFAEKQYMAPGIWGDRTRAAISPTPTHCLEHNGVFWMEPYALACLHLERRDEYLRKVRETCDRVLEHEKPGHWYPCLCCDPEAKEPFAGGAFGHGAVGEALVLGYRVLGDQQYLDAARRAVEAYRLYLFEDNQNYAAFALWHLAEVYRETQEPEIIEKGVYYLRFAAAMVDPGGAQRGHNYYSGYGSITLKGLAKFLAVLPGGHPKYPWLRDKVIRFCNQLLARQQRSGLFAERNRKYLGYHSLEPTVGLFESAFALGGEPAQELKPALVAAYNAQRDGAKPHGPVIAHMARYLANMQDRWA